MLCLVLGEEDNFFNVFPCYATTMKPWYWPWRSMITHQVRSSPAEAARLAGLIVWCENFCPRERDETAAATSIVGLFQCQKAALHKYYLYQHLCGSWMNSWHSLSIFVSFCHYTECHHLCLHCTNKENWVSHCRTKATTLCNAHWNYSNWNFLNWILRGL